MDDSKVMECYVECGKRFALLSAPKKVVDIIPFFNYDRPGPAKIRVR